MSGGRPVSASIPVQWLRSEPLGAICPRHGGPSTGAEMRNFPVNGRGSAAGPASLLAAGVVGLFTGRLNRATAVAVPTCSKCSRDGRDRRLLVGVVWTAFFVAAGTASATRGLLVQGLALVCLAAGVLLALLGDRGRVRGFLSPDQAWVDLHGVAPEFTGAAASALAARRSTPVVRGDPD